MKKKKRAPASRKTPFDRFMEAQVEQANRFNLRIREHEEREFARFDAREERERERHEQLIREVRDFRSLALGVIKQRTEIEAKQDAHAKRLDEHHQRIRALEEREADGSEK